MAVRVTYQGIEEYAIPGTGAARVTHQGIEQYATPNTGAPRVTFVAIEICVDLAPEVSRSHGYII